MYLVPNVHTYLLQLSALKTVRPLEIVTDILQCVCTGTGMYASPEDLFRNGIYRYVPVPVDAGACKETWSFNISGFACRHALHTASHENPDIPRMYRILRLQSRG